MTIVWNWLVEHRGGIAAFIAWLVTRQWFFEWAGIVTIDLLGYAALVIGGGSIAIGAVKSAVAVYKRNS